MLTKSLHTITAATNVAQFLANRDLGPEAHTGAQLAAMALRILGYNTADFPKSDPTVAKIVANCAKMLEEWR